MILSLYPVLPLCQILSPCPAVKADVMGFSCTCPDPVFIPCPDLSYYLKKETFLICGIYKQNR